MLKYNVEGDCMAKEYRQTGVEQILMLLAVALVNNGARKVDPRLIYALCLAEKQSVTPGKQKQGLVRETNTYKKLVHNRGWGLNNGAPKRDHYKSKHTV